MKLFFSSILFIILISANAQDSTYFNKLIFPQHGTNNIKSIIKLDSVYFMAYGWLDTPYVSNQGIGIMKTNKNGSIIKNSLWWDTLSIYYIYPGNSMTLSLDTFLYIVASYRKGNSGVLSRLFKVDPHTLDTIWTRTYTHPDTAASLQTGAEIYNAFTAIRQTYDGGFIISGHYHPELF